MDQNEPTCRRRCGLTTIELLLVVAILGIVAGLTLPRFGVKLLPYEEVHTTARNAVANLRLARRLAISEHVPHRLMFTPASPPYTTYSVERSHYGWRHVRGPFAIPDSVTCHGDREHRFDHLGGAAESTHIVLTSDAAKRTVRVLAATGRVWVEP